MADIAFAEDEKRGSSLYMIARKPLFDSVIGHLSKPCPRYLAEAVCAEVSLIAHQDFAAMAAKLGKDNAERITKEAP